ncbi:hypothetical protein ACRAWD_31660 [Caulobacter segnis]
MPGFWWNVGVCFLMGAAAGGMLPVAYALLADDHADQASRPEAWCWSAASARCWAAISPPAPYRPRLLPGRPGRGGSCGS